MNSLKEYITEKLKVNKDSKYKEDTRFPFSIKFTGCFTFDKCKELFEKFTQIKLKDNQLMVTPQGFTVHIIKLYNIEEFLWFLLFLHWFDDNNNKNFNNINKENLKISLDNMTYGGSEYEKIIDDIPDTDIEKYWKDFKQNVKS